MLSVAWLRPGQPARTLKDAWSKDTPLTIKEGGCAAPISHESWREITAAGGRSYGALGCLSFVHPDFSMPGLAVEVPRHLPLWLLPLLLQILLQFQLLGLLLLLLLLVASLSAASVVLLLLLLPLLLLAVVAAAMTAAIAAADVAPAAAYCHCCCGCGSAGPSHSTRHCAILRRRHFVLGRGCQGCSVFLLRSGMVFVTLCLLCIATRPLSHLFAFLKCWTE
jgi:hypothetical protein